MFRILSHVSRAWSILFLTLFATLLTFPASAFAQVPEDLISPDVSEQEILRVQAEGSPVDLYSLYFGISHDEAKRRLDLQADSARIYEVVSQEPSFAGGWIEHTPVFQQVFAVTDPKAIERVKNTVIKLEWGGGLDVRLAQRTLVELRQEHELALDILSKNSESSEFVFGSGLSQSLGKIIIETSNPERLRDLLVAEASPGKSISLDAIQIEFKDAPQVPAQYKYPYLLGGSAIIAKQKGKRCTVGYAVLRTSDWRTFTSTAGHCENDMLVDFDGPVQDDTLLGTLVVENNAFGTPPTGPFGNAVDLQVHDVSVRDFDLTNQIRVNANSTQSVTGMVHMSGTEGHLVCKYGISTGSSCGWVNQTDYSPKSGIANTFVLVHNPVWIGTIACGGDSGAPVFLYSTGSVYAYGSLSTAYSEDCNVPSQSFTYAPSDQYIRLGYYILTSRQPQQYYQNVYWANGTCTQYSTPLNEFGDTGVQQTATCPTTIPGSGNVNSYTGHAISNKLHEGSWRGNYGYIRTVPLDAFGYVNWGAASSWQGFPQATPPRAQEEYIIGNFAIQRVFWQDNTCTQYKYPLDDFGNRKYAEGTITSCPTLIPGSGDIQSYTAWVVNDQLREGMWRNNKGYTRILQLNSAKTGAVGETTVQWTECCSGTGPHAQGVYILNHP